MNFDPTLLSRIEDASLNASAPPQQRWIDGWLVRYSAGKARRARCVNAMAAGRLPLADKLRLAQAVYAEAGLTMHVRITPFSQPPTLDADLAALGWAKIELADVMVLDAPPAPRPELPPHLHWRALDGDAFARVVGGLRGSSPAEQQAHAERLRLSPTPYQGGALIDPASGATLACGQFAREGELAGLYDVYTADAARKRGLATELCEHMLSHLHSNGMKVVYLQVGADNHAARRIYQRLGFAPGYSYHYRVPGDAG